MSENQWKRGAKYVGYTARQYQDKFPESKKECNSKKKCDPIKELGSILEINILKRIKLQTKK